MKHVNTYSFSVLFVFSSIYRILMLTDELVKVIKSFITSSDVIDRRVKKSVLPGKLVYQHFFGNSFRW